MASDSNLSAIREWYAYNTFVRRRYLDLLKTLPKDVLTKDRGASYPSILDIFTHVLDAYNRWFLGFYETGKDVKTLERLSLAEVTRKEEAIEAYLARLMRNLTPEDLEKPFEFVVTEGKKREKFSESTVSMLWHLVEEDLQHRGEINAILWQENIDPPVTSWTKWKRLTNETVPF